MFVAMRYSEFVAYHALQENNRCLHLLSLYPATLTDHGVHRIRVSVKRLRASWRLLRRAVDVAVFDEADARLRAIHHLLAAPRDAAALQGVVHGLAERCDQTRAQSALRRLATSLAAIQREHRLTRAAIEQASSGFQAESSVWRELDVDRLRDEALLDGCVRTYRHGRRHGRRALEHHDNELLHRWRGWVKYAYYQLDMIRPALGRENLARRWYLDRLGDALGKYHDLLMLSGHLAEFRYSDDDRLQIERVIEVRLDEYRKRGRKLYPYCYRDKGSVFGRAVAADIARFNADRTLVLPRSA
jgi:CHAD domain-containing protein